MSDQHNATIMESAGDPHVSTPNMSRLAQDGVEFSSAYTPCPICVPSRMAFLTGHLASKTGIFWNGHELSSTQATIAHCMGAKGYETVLCGRMHFNGQDQLHGFIKRPIGDFTPCYGGRGASFQDKLGPYAGTPSGDVTKLYGGGTSPVLEYDRAVTKAAIEYLSEPHDRPIFMVVGIYGPHHTYVAPPNLYQKYLGKISPPKSENVEKIDLHPRIKNATKNFTPEETHKMRAAYYGMIEHVDGLVGEVRDAWESHLKRNDRKGLFCYTSDHGDMAGEKGLWFKNFFYEDSARVPLIITGDDVAHGKRIDSPVTLLDLAPTFCEIAETTTPPDQDGSSLVPSLIGADENTDRYILSEVMHNGLARMIRYQKWKLISYAGHEDEDQLFDLDVDPGEYTNVLRANESIAEKMRSMVTEPWDPEAIKANHEWREKHGKIIAQWGMHSEADEPYRWPIPKESWALPEK